MMAKYTITIEDVGSNPSWVKVSTSITKREIDLPRSEKTSALIIANEVYMFAHRMMAFNAMTRFSEHGSNDSDEDHGDQDPKSMGWVGKDGLP